MKFIKTLILAALLLMPAFAAAHHTSYGYGSYGHDYWYDDTHRHVSPCHDSCDFYRPIIITNFDYHDYRYFRQPNRRQYSYQHYTYDSPRYFDYIGGYSDYRRSRYTRNYW